LTFKVLAESEVQMPLLNKFIDYMVYGPDQRNILMSPIPFQCGTIKFVVERDKTGINRLLPTYNLYI